MLNKITLNINRENRNVTVRASDTLLYTLRELGLTGAKRGCENGDCGACTITIDGWPIKSCITLSVEEVGKQIITIEGLKNSPIQKAFIENAAFQCGFCTPGFIMNCDALVKIKPHADKKTIEEWLSSNICRCTCYQEIQKAVNMVLKNNRGAI
ncbi:(2Fe-2S)-binding protein [Bacillus cereus]|uniref:(2Fe-2S)-binding protein n=1 Tax=Bacillus cereus TaxID=1396 RepID=A0A9X6U5K1_BACCE|nr:(2Fe-2S)-binding protein [Bacillus cereus]PEN78896.1 (2Fe-2S)-binding protein [Bacillus cereus]